MHGRDICITISVPIKGSGSTYGLSEEAIRLADKADIKLTHQAVDGLMKAWRGNMAIRMELTEDTLTQIAQAARRRADESRNVFEIGAWVMLATAAKRLIRRYQRSRIRVSHSIPTPDGGEE